VVTAARCFWLLQVLSTAPALRRLMMGNTNITGRIPCKLFEEHELKTVMFSVNKLEGELPDCVLAVSTMIAAVAVTVAVI
jgi:hypothetical protein